jgi:chemotaxis protein methyltransferase CheR
VQDGYDNFHDYIEACLSDSSGKMINTLTTRLTTNYSYFMREDVHYSFIADTFLPEWTQKARDKDLRLWSAGCSTGEEAYTTAMVINAYFKGQKNGWDTTILATDISDRVLAEAKEATYPAGRLEKLPPGWDRRYFQKAGPETFRVKPEITREVVFTKYNLMDPFNRFRKKFHLIFCRNVMIYFDTPTKTELARKFCDALEIGGYLLVGLSETVSGMDPRLQQVSTAIYRRER